MLLSDEFESLPWSAWDDPARLVVVLTVEQFRRDGGVGQLGGAGRAKAIMHMQLSKTALQRKRAKAA